MTGSLYCSDLIYLAFAKVSGGKMGRLEKLGDLDWKPYAGFIQSEAEGHLPLDSSDDHARLAGSRTSTASYLSRGAVTATGSSHLTSDFLVAFPFMPHRYLFILLAALSMTGALSIDAYLPALPTIAQNFSSTLPAVQQTLTVYLCSFAFMTLFYGMLSDSLGAGRSFSFRSRFISAARWARRCADTRLALFFRLLQGFSAARAACVGRAIVADLLTGAEAQRSLAAISMVFGLAPALAPVLAAGCWPGSAGGRFFLRLPPSFSSC